MFIHVCLVFFALDFTEHYGHLKTYADFYPCEKSAPDTISLKEVFIP